MPGTVAFVLKGYPRLSETFIAQEILALERRGLDIRIASLRRPTDSVAHPIHGEIEAPVSYLPEYLHREPMRVLRAWWAARRRPGYRRAREAWLRDLRREPKRDRIRRFGQALVLAHELSEDVAHVHAHFLHTPASVTRYASMIRELPWSCSAHARDIWTTPDWEKSEKLGELEWLVTCTENGRVHLAGLAPAEDRVELVYHGLDFERFPAPPDTAPDRDGGDPDDPVVVLSVGRAVEKKGYDVLLRALAGLPGDIHWRFVHVGDGPLLDTLKRQAAALGIASRVTWRGSQTQDAVIESYREADLFVLPSRIAGDGDRDGLPNVLIEAQSQGIACISTWVAAVPELIEDGRTGLLVASEDEAALGAALQRLIADPGLRRRLGDDGADLVRSRFCHTAGIDRLARKFGIEEHLPAPKAMPRRTTTTLALIRHGPTAWNEERRIQGRTDIPLSPVGRDEVRGWRLPPELANVDWQSSPLKRAVETAKLLGASPLKVDPRIAEMNWGAWEGRRLVDLRDELGAEMADNEAQGLDFRPKDGETPRELQVRLIPWLKEVSKLRRATVAVTHKGVIHAVMALATGWQMTDDPPAKIKFGAAQLFDIDAEGQPHVGRLNVDLFNP